jgi:hypothetical protein
VPMRHGASNDAAKRAPSRAAPSCSHQLENTDAELRGVATSVAVLAALLASAIPPPSQQRRSGCSVHWISPLSPERRCPCVTALLERDSGVCLQYFSIPAGGEHAEHRIANFQVADARTTFAVGGKQYLAVQTGPLRCMVDSRNHNHRDRSALCGNQVRRQA